MSETIKMRLPARVSGFSFAGEELKVTATKTGKFVDVPLAGIADAETMGLIDADAPVDDPTETPADTAAQ